MKHMVAIGSTKLDDDEWHTLEITPDAVKVRVQVQGAVDVLLSYTKSDEQWIIIPYETKPLEVAIPPTNVLFVKRRSSAGKVEFKTEVWHKLPGRKEEKDHGPD